MSALFAWIARDQEERREHELKKAIRRFEEDKHYMKLIVDCLTKFKCTKKEKIMLLNFARVNKDGRNLSDGQRSVITGIYYKKIQAS